jgi:CO/xanthine dehydrogenase FAD-binding subunit
VAVPRGKPGATTAGVRKLDLFADRWVHERYPVLAQAPLAGVVGQLAHLATTSGNLLQ